MNPPAFITDKLEEATVMEGRNKQVEEHPVFVNVIAMIPKCIFWATVQPVARYSSLAFDCVVEKLTGLTL